jgi:hypothetical protein
LKIVFEVSRSDAEILAKHLFSVNTEQVKHTVQQGIERSHPVYYSLPEQWEHKSQFLQSMPARVAFVKRVGSKNLINRLNQAKIMVHIAANAISCAVARRSDRIDRVSAVAHIHLLQYDPIPSKGGVPCN